MKKKKMIVFTLCSIMSIGILAGCSPKKATSNENKTTTTEKKVNPNEKNATSNENKQGSSTTSKHGSIKNFSAKTLSGGTFTQDNLKKADITAISFWNTSCKSCVKEMPKLATIAKGLPKNINMVTAVLDGDSNKEVAKKILSNAGFKNTTLTSGDGDWSSITKKIQSTPTTIFVDSRGNIVVEPLVGSAGELSKTYKSSDLAKIYKDSINNALKSIGKPALK
ncbi:hypothetical protein TEGL_17390 [Terrisporobacter glycolicus ATCC 14880 = DSM 1288]|uniref:Alkyl hydroperoxide reductase subunit C/ Thiol specific antioxidant domain-containing protein n=2 Tax=Terrisporobacter glycolicus TaxID=36841 RepID=A0ABZ2EV33_9FIRM